MQGEWWGGESHITVIVIPIPLPPQAVARRRFIRLRCSSSAVVCTPSWSTMASRARHPMATFSVINTIPISKQSFVEFYRILGQYTIKIDKQQGQVKVVRSRRQFGLLGWLLLLRLSFRLLLHLLLLLRGCLLCRRLVPLLFVLIAITLGQFVFANPGGIGTVKGLGMKVEASLEYSHYGGSGARSPVRRRILLEARQCLLATARIGILVQLVELVILAAGL